MAISIAPALAKVPRVSRVPRRPEHRWYLRTPPFCIQPFIVAPVLAGETVQNVLMQARVVSDPVKNPLIGWWNEYYLYYVKLTDLEALAREPRFNSVISEATADQIKSMLIDPDASVAGLTGAVAYRPAYAAAISQINWTAFCLYLVTGFYFRDDDEVFTTYQLTDTNTGGQTYYSARINHTNAFQSAMLEAAYDAPPDTPLTVGGDDSFTMQELADKFREWQLQRQYGFTTLTYDDYLREQGVSVPRGQEVNGQPEELRYWRNWSYPANTVDPATGNPSSALSWAIQERMDQKVFCREPGFIFGVTVARPKVYLAGQTSSVSHFLSGLKDWLPAALREDAYSSIKEFAAAAGPRPGATTPYFIDLRDLFMYGDQLLNVDLTSTDAGLVALPTTAMQQKYPSWSDVTGLFDASTACYIRQDGVAQLTILGHQQDRTVGT